VLFCRVLSFSSPPALARRFISSLSADMSQSRVDDSAGRPLLDGSEDATSHAAMRHHDISPAYKALYEAGLIVNAFRIKTSDDIESEKSNSTMSQNLGQRGLAYVGGLIVGGLLYDCMVKQFTVKGGCLRPAMHQDGRFFFYGAGVHKVPGMFISISQNDVDITDAQIQHGNRVICTVPQGFIGLAEDKGEPIVLPPGLHQWKSATMKFDKIIDLQSNVIRIGPLTLLTIDEGYAAVTQNNGKQKVLKGGQSFMLTHRNWKFEKFISVKIHTDDLGPFRSTTADNVVLNCTAVVCWQISDPSLSARMAAETMDAGGRAIAANVGPRVTGTTDALRRDVLKQAVSSLASSIGSIRYADEVHVAANVTDAVNSSSVTGTLAKEDVEDESGAGRSEIFSAQQMSHAAKHANEICGQYGVSVVSISIVSATPADNVLQVALSAGAVSAAEALQAEIAARGNAKAMQIHAQANAEALRVSAQSNADSAKIVAMGKRDAAKKIADSPVAVDLARLERAGKLIGDNKAFFFGSDPQEIPALMTAQK